MPGGLQTPEERGGTSPERFVRPPPRASGDPPSAFGLPDGAALHAGPACGSVPAPEQTAGLPLGWAALLPRAPPGFDTPGGVPQPGPSSRDDDVPKASRVRPCKGKRDRVKRALAMVETKIALNPKAFDDDDFFLPASVEGDPRMRSQVLARLSSIRAACGDSPGAH
mmetsp:Transcript_64815/g.181223  ORF Transcript_64815/g.181223 Transcript_64815/m.181223 type:complete len:167 (+) Transcript_64815:78-578(+)